MKEIRDIVTAFDKACLEGSSCALATVVQVEGSSYRRPGARMLVTDKGMLTGAISGGCLEGDALRKALLAIREGCNKLVTYDTTDEDDAKFGIQLGCNGIVHILFEPVNAADKYHPIYFLKRALEKRENAVLVTLFSLGQKERQTGTCYLGNQKGCIACTESFRDFQQSHIPVVTTNIAQAFEKQRSVMIAVNAPGQPGDAFIQFLLPPVSLVIAGAGNDALPLASLGYLLGWDIIIVDGRNTHATKNRFPRAKNIIVGNPEKAVQAIFFDATTVCILMTHNYNYDIAMLQQLLGKSLLYVGILGPKSKVERMFDDLDKAHVELTGRQKENIYSPAGLDIGAETAEEIALSIVAEIKSVLMGKNAQMLRNKKVPIHS